MKKKVLTGVVWCVVLALAVGFLNALFMPKYMSSIPEGAMIAEYYKEPTDHDVLFVGDCEVYENFSPDVLWREYGMVSYIRGSAQQLIWQSYYLLEEMLEKESPKVVVFNVLSMKYGEPQNEAYNRMSIDGMKWSSHKIGSIRASMTEEESMLSYLLPLLRYHGRWKELSGEDFTYLLRRDEMTDSGYLMNVEVRPAANVPGGKPLADYQFADTCYDYLDKMADLCEEKGAQLVLIKAPSLYPYWYDEWNDQIEEYAEKRGLPYLNFLENADEIGIDYETDTYDSGLHLNLYGAEKLSHWFGAWLQENCDVPDRRGEEPYQSAWEEKSEIYAARKAKLEAEWVAEQTSDGKEEQS